MQEDCTYLNGYQNRYCPIDDKECKLLREGTQQCMFYVPRSKIFSKRDAENLRNRVLEISQAK